MPGSPPTTAPPDASGFQLQVNDALPAIPPSWTSFRATTSRLANALLYSVCGITSEMSQIILQVASTLYTDIFLCCYPVRIHGARYAHIRSAMAIHDTQGLEAAAPNTAQAQWSAFHTRILNELELVGILSGVLLTGIATFSQIAALSGDPIACTLALIALIDALHSLAAAVAFVPHFKDMVPLARGRRWIRDGERLCVSPAALLAAPVAWLLWASICAIAASLVYLWAKALDIEPALMSPARWVVPGVVVTGVTLLNAAHLLYAISAFRRLGAGCLEVEGVTADPLPTAEQTSAGVIAQVLHAG